MKTFRTISIWVVITALGTYLATALAVMSGFNIYQPILPQLDIAKISQLERENGQLIQSVSSLKEQVGQLEREHSQLDQQIANLKDRYTNANARIAQLESENARLEREKQNLQDQLAERPRPPDVSPTTPVDSMTPIGDTRCIELLEQGPQPIGPNPYRIDTERDRIRVYFNSPFQSVCIQWISTLQEVSSQIVKCEPAWYCPMPRRKGQIWIGHPYNVIQIFGVYKDGSLRAIDKEYACQWAGSQINDWYWYCKNDMVGLSKTNP